MMWTTLALVSLVMAAMPAAVMTKNLQLYRRLPKPARRGEPPRVSVLIPARDEERNIGPALLSVLSNTDVNLEVLVLDDHSSDGTARIVEDWTQRDRRVRLVRGVPLPKGANGKQHACDHLARYARNPILVFMDADVRLSNDALARMAMFLDESGAALVSGIPRQRTGSFGERLIIPLIHFVLLGFLPLWRMRRSRHPAYAAGVGQLFVARAKEYWRAGGHAAILSSRHDGLDLPRAFRRIGLSTDLFDATDVADCRMYSSSRETWQGFVKNADQGLGRPSLIVQVSALLLAGQVLPWVLLLAAPWLDPLVVALAAIAAAAPVGVRVMAGKRFRQPLQSALLHPLSVAALVAIQWHALGRRLLGRPASWKGRSYPTTKGDEVATPVASRSPAASSLPSAS